MSFADSNWCPQAAVMLHNGFEISPEMQIERKSVFLEGLIRFLEIYAQTEIGEGMEIDIMKVALYINSPSFENDDLYSIESIDDVYSLLEVLTISGLPVWRFLKLSEYQKRIFEAGYSDLLITAKERVMNERPCYGCIWYKEEESFLGIMRMCNRPRVTIEFHRRGAHNPNNIVECEWLTTMTKVPDAINNNDILHSIKRQFIDRIESARKRFQEKVSRDPFRIPLELEDVDIVDLNKTYGALENMACASNNKRTPLERQYEIRRAMFTEGMIRFFEIYAKNEMGSRYIADIKNIALFIRRLKDSDLVFIKNFNDVYAVLEKKIIGGFNVAKFVKFDES